MLSKIFLQSLKKFFIFFIPMPLLLHELKPNKNPMFLKLCKAFPNKTQVFVLRFFLVLRGEVAYQVIFKCSANEISCRRGSEKLLCFLVFDTIVLFEQRTISRAFSERQM